MSKLNPTIKQGAEQKDNVGPDRQRFSMARIVERIKGMQPADWLKVSLIANIVIVVLLIVGFGGMAVIHESDTNPNFCGTCHLMQPQVTSYLTNNHMDNFHMRANVECKQCHDYSVVAEATSGVNFLIGNYEVNKDGALLQRKYPDSMCFKCHVSYTSIANQTSFLPRNPHSNHNGQLHCYECHISHGAQIDYCSGCHENCGQRMIEDSAKPRPSMACDLSNVGDK
jgi:nitrate/TMAO reductase-like tetraheme cytochrome c subunit